MNVSLLLRRATSITLLALLLAGCTTSKKIGKVLMDPNIQVGSFADQPSTLNLTLLADRNININEDGEATPINLQVIYLTEDSRLLALDFDELDDEKNSLPDLIKKNYINHQDYTLLPGQFKPLKPIKLKEENRYIGVVAYFADANISEWKKIVKADGKGHIYNLLVHVKEREIELQKEEE